MGDKRRHRGPHPEDRSDFAEAELSRLRAATADLSWLLSRRYAIRSATTLVGDRYSLTERQRIAVRRCTCSDKALSDRLARRIDVAPAPLDLLWIDGFNVITTVEAALAGGAILIGRDGCFRDMASMHGSFRAVDETRAALELIGETLVALHVGNTRWLLDQPVSNSGRLRQMMGILSDERGWNWEVKLVASPDAMLRQKVAVASADSGVLDYCGAWLDLARMVISRHVPDPWIVDLRS